MHAMPNKKSYGLIRLGKRSVLTLGADLTRELSLTDGDLLEICVQDGKIILEPKKVIPADQEWFWTKEWQAGEREAQTEIDTGMTKRAYSAKEFMKELMKDGE